MPLLDLNSIPGYREAAERESFDRNAAFLPVLDQVCGLPANHLTLELFGMLSAAGCPFICGGSPMPSDVARFLWVISPGFKPGKKLLRTLFVRRIRKLNYVKSCEEIGEFVSRTFMDSSGGGGSGKSYFSIHASLIDTIASQYGWSEAEISKIPIRRIFQYFRAMKARTQDRPIFFNPSDRIISDYAARAV